nr:inositol hexakisphosphate kinase 2-like [Megalopta genalis]
MIYGSSNDEFCFEQSSDIAEGTSSDMEVRSDSGPKRQRHGNRLLRLYEKEERTEEEVECDSISNRYASCNYRTKNKQKSQEALVDVRMIDFAHTTFVHGSATVACNSNSTVHQGPDCNFLTGLDSLKRLLLEILTEG